MPYLRTIARAGQVILGLALILFGFLWGLIWAGIAFMGASYGVDDPVRAVVIVGLCLLLAAALIAAGVYLLTQDSRGGRGRTARLN